MGNSGVALNSEDAFAPFSNPGMLGVAALRTGFTLDLLPMTWVPSLFDQCAGCGYDERTYSSGAGTLGYNLSSVLGLPFPLSVGIGFSSANLDVHREVSAVDIFPFTLDLLNNQSDSYLFAIGVDKGIRAGIGVTLNHYSDAIGEFWESGFRVGANTQMERWTNDIGLFAEVPLDSLLFNPAGKQVFLFGGARPSLIIGTGYQQKNVGKRFDIPTKGVLAFVVRFGFSVTQDPGAWEIFSVTMTREAEDHLIRYSYDIDSLGDVVNETRHRETFGHFQFIRNFILGDWGGTDIVRSGLEVGLGDFAFGRIGSVRSADIEENTVGYGFKLSGFLRLLQAMQPPAAPSGFVMFLVRHADIRFDNAFYLHHSYSNVTMTVR